MNIKLICVGRLKERFYTDAANEYIKRLSAYCKLEIVEIAESRVSTGDSEYSAITQKIPDSSYTIALCIEGRPLDSRELSELISSCALNGKSRLCFVIGGSDGLGDKTKDAADMRLSLSKMTFPHNLARVILLEQLYRAFNITDGGKYHK